ncbi:hypothetical protein SLEP1_g37861 [Rubroshorea leprosula]|uniref:Cytochrome P450 n=1 Tax=Rubroshorea leprosula TaxID=152421 RepID=A0AAV5KW28_9ROSI|nr:hypothetical protein SLEP1_g37861 [Rubroshorea leprosula]
MQKQKQRLWLPPGPRKLPIIGNLHQIGAVPHQSFAEMSKKHGPVMLVHPGFVPKLIVSSADAAKELLKAHELDSCGRPPLTGAGELSYNYLNVAFTAYGDYWRVMRRLYVIELLSIKRVQSFRFIREEEVEFLIKSISEFSKLGTPVNLSEKLISLTADVTGRVAFGKSFKEREYEYFGADFEEEIHEAVVMLGNFAAADFFPYCGWIVDRITGLHRRLERNFKKLDAFFQKVLDDHLCSGRRITEEEHEDIIDVLIKIGKYETASGTEKITHNHIKAILMDIFLGGSHTTAISMAWAMAELAKNPRVIKKAQEEIRNSAVVKENWRLQPPGTLLAAREAITRFNVSGYTIDPKTQIQVNVWAIWRDPNAWENPQEFYPERFLDSPIDFKGQNYEFLPFGSGRRICTGVHKAVAVVELTLANLLYCFAWKLPEGMTEEDICMEEEAGIAVQKKVPLKLIPVEYQCSSESKMYKVAVYLYLNAKHHITCKDINITTVRRILERVFA